jgi:hypothetical protein
MKRPQSHSPVAKSKKSKTFPESEKVVQSDRAGGDEWTTVTRRKQRKPRKDTVEDESVRRHRAVVIACHSLVSMLLDQGGPSVYVLQF